MTQSSANDTPCDNSSPIVVAVKGAEKCFKSGKPILHGLNMAVDNGSIYGLLGSSGCGKTTLLSCILGQMALDDGNIRIFGEKPGTRQCGVPGRNVGYMPQDISLFLEFTILETLMYFGGLVGMMEYELRGAAKSLLELLDLPNKNSRVGTLSGGEQRRVSLATALVHNPKLLILDEPTVGLDPLIRERIWTHLKSIMCEKQATIVLTTHYIEECRQADKIGVMRDGRLLVEESPHNLFLMYRRNDLEGIVLSLCKGITPPASLTAASNENFITNDVKGDQKMRENHSVRNEVKLEHYGKDSTVSASLTRIKKLAVKNIIILKRNPL